MRLLTAVVLSSMTTVYARNLKQKLQYAHVRKDIPFANTTTTVDANITSTSTIVTDSLSSTASTATTTTSSSTSLLTTTIQVTTPKLPDLPVLTTTSQGSPLPTYPNVTTTEPTCIGTITYSGFVPPTVFVTVTEGYDVTVTASNISVTASETLVTPLPPCTSTILPEPLFNSLESGQASFSKPATGKPPPNPFMTAESSAPGLQPDLATGDPERSFTQTATAVYSSVSYTSTVTVTKKTPVTVVSPPTTTPPVDFRTPKPTTDNDAGNDSPPPATVFGGGGGPGDNNKPSPGGNNGPSTTSNDGNINPAVNDPKPTANPTIPGSSNGLGIGNIIASIISSRFTMAPNTVAPRSTTINGVPVVVLPSSVVIDGQTFAIPEAATTSIQVDGMNFELRPTAIIAPSATITLPPSRQDQAMTITPRPQITTVTAGDHLTFLVGQTVAIISGTTYRVGQGAPSTTVTVDGTAISIGPNGVGLPRSTVAPLAATASGYVVYTVDGITLSVDENEAVVSGTTYRIGSNAPQMTTAIAGETVSFGPGGIGLRSTTIAPTGVPASTESAISTASSSSTEDNTNTTNAAPGKSKIPFSEMLGWYLIAMPLFYHVIS